MKKSKAKLLALITLSLSGMVVLEPTAVKAANSNEAVTEYTDVASLQEVNDGQTPEVYEDDNNKVKFIDGSYTDIQVKNGDDALTSLNSVKSLMNLDYPEDEFEVKDVNTSKYLTSYKLQQVYNSIPVYGREMVVVTDKEGTTTSVGGNYLKDINVPTSPVLNSETALASVKEKYGTDSTVSNEELVVYSLNEKTPTLCWKVEVSGVKEDKSYTVNAFVNALNGTMVDEISLLTKAAATATAKDLSGKSRTFNVYQGTTGNWWTGRKNTYQLYDTVRKIKIYDASNGRIPGTLMTDSTNTWNDPAAVSAMVNIASTYDYYLNILGRKSYDNRGAEIVASIHYKEGRTGYDNAFWSSSDNQFVFGDGYQYFTPLTGALDVTAHELTHAVIDRTANLQYQGESGALNEAYADIMGNLVEGDNDSKWLIGEDIMKPGAGAALRSMSKPEDFSQPSVVGGQYYASTRNPSSYNDYGGVHTNSGILNHAAYLMWKNGITDKTKLAELFYNSLFIMNSTSNFSDCRAAVLSAAKNINMTSSEISIIKSAFDSVGITK